MRSNKSYVKETLAFVNKIRRDAGADPLDDLRQGRTEGGTCPISSSLVDAVERPYTSSFAVIGYGEVSRRIVPGTRAVQRFIRAFDSGRLPEYHV